MMTPVFRMKRPRSPDPIGIDNYKRQRLVLDFEKLSIGTKGNEGIKKHKIDSGLSSLKGVLDRKMWSAVERELSGNQNDKIYDKLFEHLRQFNMQIIKWYDWRSLVADTWVKWVQRQRTMYLSTEEDYPGYNLAIFRDNGIEKPPYTIDDDVDMDMDVDMDAEPELGIDLDMDMEIER